MDFEDVIKKAIIGGLEAEAEKMNYKSRSHALDEMEKFLSTPTDHIKEGDILERNEYGKHKHKFPDKNQAAKCLKVFDEYQLQKEEGAGLYNMLMAVAIRPGVIMTYPADTRYFKKVEATGNLVRFRKKKD